MTKQEQKDQLQANKVGSGQNFRLKAYQDNLRTSMVVESLFDNLDYIPLNELEELIDKYKKF